MKTYLKDQISSPPEVLTAKILAEKAILADFAVQVIKGSSKKTHLLREQRKKMSILKTLMSQKKYLDQKD